MRKYDTDSKLFLSLLLLAIISGSFIIFDQENKLNEQTNNNNNLVNEYNELVEKYTLEVDKNNQEKCIMYDANKDVNENKSIPNGLYWLGTDFYCVWTKDRTYDAINKTDDYEFCHNLVYNNYEHFCEGVNIQ